MEIKAENKLTVRAWEHGKLVFVFIKFVGTAL